MLKNPGEKNDIKNCAAHYAYYFKILSKLPDISLQIILIMIKKSYKRKCGLNESYYFKLN